MNTDMFVKYRVIDEYRTRFHDPIRLAKGERIRVGDRDTDFAGWIWVITKDGNSGWAPERLLELRDDGTADIVDDYDATELNTILHEPLLLIQELNEWGLMQRDNGECGWVPMKTLEIIDTK